MGKVVGTVADKAVAGEGKEPELASAGAEGEWVAAEDGKWAGAVGNGREAATAVDTALDRVAVVADNALAGVPAVEAGKLAAATAVGCESEEEPVEVGIWLAEELGHK